MKKFMEEFHKMSAPQKFLTILAVLGVVWWAYRRWRGSGSSAATASGVYTGAASPTGVASGPLPGYMTPYPTSPYSPGTLPPSPTIPPQIVTKIGGVFIPPPGTVAIDTTHFMDPSGQSYTLYQNTNASPFSATTVTSGGDIYSSVGTGKNSAVPAHSPTYDPGYPAGPPVSTSGHTAGTVAGAVGQANNGGNQVAPTPSHPTAGPLGTLP